MTYFIRKYTMLLSALGVLALAGPGIALDAPQGTVLLRISGEIDKANDGAVAAFDIDMLRAMEPQTIRTSTIWTEGVQEFTGVPLHEFVEMLGIEEGTLRAIAVNDYAVTIPLDDAQEGHAMIAFERNGRPMPLRNKGPLWLIYPYDSDERFQSEAYYARSIWQLNRLEVVD